MPKKQKDILVKDKNKVGKPKRYKVVFYNDDFTPMNFVTLVLHGNVVQHSQQPLHLHQQMHPTLLPT